MRQPLTARAAALLWAVAALVMGVLDALWLGVLAIDVYRAQLGPLLAPAPD